jgi:HEAT repeat protein
MFDTGPRPTSPSRTMSRASQPYSPPVDRLLTLGEAPARAREWPDYLEFGLGKEHVSDLVRMATDEDLLWTDSGGAEVWAPIHAWRALGQLRAEEAIGPLVDFLPDLEEIEWGLEEFPVVFGMIGPPALARLSAYAADASNDLWTRIAAVEGLREIGEVHPAARGEGVAALVRVLEKWYRNDETLNGFLIHYLVGLGAVEAAPLMEQAFAAERVDLMVQGDWEDVQVDLGLLPERRTPRPGWHVPPIRGGTAPRPPRRPSGGNKPKAKRKMAAQARKRNRRRK